MFRTPLVAAALLASAPALAAEPAGARVEVNGMEMYYAVLGEGDPVVVPHGSYAIGLSLCGGERDA